MGTVDESYEMMDEMAFEAYREQMLIYKHDTKLGVQDE